MNLILAFLVFLPFLGGLICYAVGSKNERGRDYLADAITIAEMVILIFLFGKYAHAAGEENVLNCYLPGICGFGLHFTMEGFRLIYGMIAALMWMMTTILSREYFLHHENRNRFYLFLLLTEGATMGVFLSADLYTTFIFFEIMSFTSYVWVAQEENEASLRAAATYLAVAVIGGLVMLMGIFLIYHELGTVAMDQILQAAENCSNPALLYTAGVCMLVGFGAKAGAFPLHIWLPKAHPVAPAPASALLSGILTKTGIYGTLVITCNLFLHDMAWGKLILTIGVLTMFGGAMLAVFSIDLKRTLACSSMSQIGFIMVGIGMQCLLGEENALAVHGSMLHMMNHSLIKLVLFMAAGVIYMNTHSLDLNQIRGFGRKKPLLKVIFLIGALAIGGIPMFSGYISKTMIHESIVEFGGGFVMKMVEYIFLFSGGLTVAYMTKLFAAIFVEKNNDPARQAKYDKMKSYMNAESVFALGGSALILLIWGLCPHGLMEKAAQMGQMFMHLEEEEEEAIAFFSWTNLSGGLISIGIGILVYLLFIRRFLMDTERKNGKVLYINRWPAWLDMENLIYRPLLLGFLPFVFGLICRIADSFADTMVVLLRKSIFRDSKLPHERTEGSVFTAALGFIFNQIYRFRNAVLKKQDPSEKHYEHKLALYFEELRENNLVIFRSMSFGLMMAAIGLALTLIYLIWFV